MARTINKSVKPYALVKLYCNKYNRKEIPEDTPIKDLPRLLVVKIHTDSREAIVKYPSGIVNRVGLECINTNSIINPDNPKYKSYCVENTRLVEHEARRNDSYKNILTKVSYPFIDKAAQGKAYEPLPKANPVPAPIVAVINAELPKQDTNTLLAAIISEQRKTNLLLERLCRLWESDNK